MFHLPSKRSRLRPLSGDSLGTLRAVPTGLEVRLPWTEKYVVLRSRPPQSGRRRAQETSVSIGSASSTDGAPEPVGDSSPKRFAAAIAPIRLFAPSLR